VEKILDQIENRIKKEGTRSRGEKGKKVPFHCEGKSASVDLQIPAVFFTSRGREARVIEKKGAGSTPGKRPKGKKRSQKQALEQKVGPTKLAKGPVVPQKKKTFP